MYREKTDQAVEILKEKNIDCWITFVRETHTMHDPSLDFLCPTALTWQSALIISTDGKKTAIVGNLDAAAVEDTGIFDRVIAYKAGITSDLVSYLENHLPDKIAINFSEDSEMADGLSHGMYLNLLKYLKGTAYPERFVSSEGIISALRGRKTPEELKRMKEAVRITAEIFDQITKEIKPGMTEKETAALILEKVTSRKLETSWSSDTCPSVFTGPDTAGAHYGPTDRSIERGHIMNMDFGVKKDEYVSDMQRTWYVLRENEKEPPKEVTAGFNVLLGSIKAAVAILAPGREGWEIDKAARDYITKHGYEEYPHALGHQVGRAAHDGHGLLAPEWERYGDRPYAKIEVGQVYTIEPRLTVEGYGVVTIEEEVVVTEDGCEFLTEPQTELLLIKNQP